MADTIQQLAEYKLQLQQVEAALTTDPENEDLQKLKHDLEEVLALTTQLVVSQQTTEESDTGHSNSTLPQDLYTDSTATPAEHSTTQEASHSWKVGDSCNALYSEDQQYYEAVIDEILEDGTCTVTFDSYGNTDVTTVSQLRPLENSAEKHLSDGQGGPDSKKPKTKKDMMLAQREYKRKKNQKKAQRQKQLEEERETEKNKWIDFNSKAFSKTNKGRVKKSIFATPDSVSGRVGVGTCGTGGAPMTSYAQQEKYMKK